MEHYTEANCRKLALEHGALLVKLSPIAGLAGIPDRLLLWWGAVVFIEFKATGRYLKPRQKWWRDWLTRHGFRVYLFRSTAEFRDLLDSLPKPRQTPS